MFSRWRCRTEGMHQVVFLGGGTKIWYLSREWRWGIFILFYCLGREQSGWIFKLFFTDYYFFLLTILCLMLIYLTTQNESQKSEWKYGWEFLFKSLFWRILNAFLTLQRFQMLWMKKFVVCPCWWMSSTSLSIPTHSSSTSTRKRFTLTSKWVLDRIFGPDFLLLSLLILKAANKKWPVSSPF